MDLPSRKRLRSIFITVILATLPCYCTGLAMVGLEQLQASQPISTPTPPSQTQLPTLTRIPSLTAPPSATASPTTELPTLTPTLTASD